MAYSIKQNQQFYASLTIQFVLTITCTVYQLFFMMGIYYLNRDRSENEYQKYYE